MRSGFLFSMIVAIILCAPAQAYDWSTNPGDGTEANPYQISTPEQLMSIGSNVGLLDKHFELINDIVFDPNNNPAHVFDKALIAPDIEAYSGHDGPRFSGKFDGGGCVIENLSISINDSRSSYLGLFGYIYGGTIKNLGIANVSMRHNSENPDSLYCGGLAGQVENSTITGCFATVNIEKVSTVGGLIGIAENSTVISCFSSGNIQFEGLYGGGLIGYCSSGIVEKSHSMCSISGVEPASFYTTSSIGGLIGINEESTVNECHNVGAVTGVGNYIIGGLIGNNYRGEIYQCFNYGAVTGTDSNHVGGLIGENEYATISECYNAGPIVGQFKIGGLVGNMYGGSIHDSYSTGSVTGKAQAGGLVGYSSRSHVVKCYSVGLVAGENIGGLVGNLVDDSFEVGVSMISRSFWDIETSNVAISAGGIGGTTKEMQKAEIYRLAGWGGQTWTIEEGGDYPRLAWEDHVGIAIQDPVVPFSGSGTEQDPWQLTTVDDLLFLSKASFFWDKSLILMQDIVFDPNDPEHIFSNALLAYDENPEWSFEGTPFTGTFDGNGHAIVNLKINNNTDSQFIGLIGFLGQNGIVKNLALNNIAISGTGIYMGGLVGYNKRGYINNSYASGTLEGENVIGSIAGYVYNGEITYSRSSCEVAGDSSIGGIAGVIASRSLLLHCKAEGHVTGTGNNSGGVAGKLRGGSAVHGCENTGIVSGYGTVGGIAGLVDGGSIRQSVNFGPISGYSNVGGLVGDIAWGGIRDSFSVSEIDGINNVGGLAGKVDGTIIDSYCEGTVHGDSNVGGLIGFLWGVSPGIYSVKHCYSACSVNGGGLIGYVFGKFYSNTIENSYFHNTCVDNGYGNPLTEEQIKTQISFENWDFMGETANGVDDIWRMCVDGVAYPKLWWEFGIGDFACDDGVDIADYAMLARTWMLSAGQAGYNDRCDLADNDTIDLMDLAIYCDHWLNDE